MNWLTNLEQAKEESLKTKKVILLQFEMDGCGGCKKMNATTYKDQKVIDELNEWFVLLKLDLIKDREVRKMLGAYWTPAFYFLDNNGNSFYHFNGYLPAEEFRAMLRLGIAETIMPRGRYDDIIKIIDKNIDELSGTSLYPRLLVTRETARYIKIKDNSQLRKTLKEIQHAYPHSTEAKMYFWDE
ncbi:thioredoxin family protein [Ignavibacterium album]|uniref:thioredoxin family protein n=1 Tax=Ignavibacterium album TaxID=591197 RepID=UPI0026EB6794|nr:thioredoxin family protein [Ignavibacterium album]